MRVSARRPTAFLKRMSLRNITLQLKFMGVVGVEPTTRCPCIKRALVITFHYTPISKNISPQVCPALIEGNYQSRPSNRSIGEPLTWGLLKNYLLNPRNSARRLYPSSFNVSILSLIDRKLLLIFLYSLSAVIKTSRSSADCSIEYAFNLASVHSVYEAFWVK